MKKQNTVARGDVWWTLPARILVPIQIVQVLRLRHSEIDAVQILDENAFGPTRIRRISTLESFFISMGYTSSVPLPYGRIDLGDLLTILE